MIFVGVDWAEADHDVHVQDEEDRRLGSGRLPEGVEGIARFHELVRRPCAGSGRGRHRDRDRPESVRACCRRLRGVRGELDVDLALSGSTLERGARSDSGDAKVLADMVRTDQRNHRPVAGDSETAEALKVLARAHQSMIWSRGRKTNF